MTKWKKGYKEIKNLLHNELGIEKEELQDLLKHVALTEIKEIVGNDKELLYGLVKEAIDSMVKTEMIKVINKEGYPKITHHMNSYLSSNDYNDYFASYMKTQIEEMLHESFKINFNIEMKS